MTTTTDAIRRAGLVLVLAALLLTLTVAVLRLAAVPLAMAVLALDALATLAAGYLPTPPPVGGGSR